MDDQVQVVFGKFMKHRFYDFGKILLLMCYFLMEWNESMLRVPIALDLAL